MFEKLAPQHQPTHELEQTIGDIKPGLERIKFDDGKFRKSRLIRLETLNTLKAAGCLNEALRWR